MPFGNNGIAQRIGMSRRECELAVARIMIGVELHPISARNILAERRLDLNRHAAGAQIVIISDPPQLVAVGISGFHIHSVCPVR